MSNYLEKIKENLEDLKNRSPEKFLLLFILSGLVFCLWGYIIFFLPQENNSSIKESKEVIVSDIEKKNFNFANGNKNDKIDSKDANKQQLDRIDDKQFRNSPFKYQEEVDSSQEGVFIYQRLENDQLEKESISLAELYLKGIIITEGNNLAIIEKDNRNEHYHINDHLGGYLIDEIDFESVTLKNQSGSRYKLQFED